MALGQHLATSSGLWGLSVKVHSGGCREAQGEVHGYPAGDPLMPSPEQFSAIEGGFLVICDARTGSGFLCDRLDQHPELACHHELFNSHFMGSKYGVEPFHRSSETDPLAYLADVRARTRVCSGARLIGFKLHFRHSPTVLEHVLNDRKERIILLRRRDKLAQWGSYQLANATGQWTRTNHAGEPHSLKRVPFAFWRYVVFLVHQQAWEQHVLGWRPDCLRVHYEDLLVPGGLAPLLRGLGVDSSVEPRSASQRQFTGDSTCARFTNPRWAATASRIGQGLSILLALLGATPMIRRLTNY